ncbi:MAG: hypothetical protein IKR33_00640 [Bacteroidales bacterium]|nr:hypothetical protein [Bacteroidales bacterium]
MLQKYTIFSTYGNKKKGGINTIKKTPNNLSANPLRQIQQHKRLIHRTFAVPSPYPRRTLAYTSTIAVGVGRARVLGM